MKKCLIKRQRARKRWPEEAETKKGTRDRKQRTRSGRRPGDERDKKDEKTKSKMPKQDFEIIDTWELPSECNVIETDKGNYIKDQTSHLIKIRDMSLACLF